MKYIIIFSTLAIFGYFNINLVEANDFKRKMECLQKGNHWENGSCYRRNNNSSSKYQNSKRVQGDSDEYFYKKSTAIDLAETELMNNTSSFCGTSYKSEIDWHDRETTCKKRNSQYRCKVYATANCLSESCGRRFCGTKR